MHGCLNLQIWRPWSLPDIVTCFSHMYTFITTLVHGSDLASTFLTSRKNHYSIYILYKIYSKFSVDCFIILIQENCLLTFFLMIITCCLNISYIFHFASHIFYVKFITIYCTTINVYSDKYKKSE